MFFFFVVATCRFSIVLLRYPVFLLPSVALPSRLGFLLLACLNFAHLVGKQRALDLFNLMPKRPDVVLVRVQLGVHDKAADEKRGRELQCAGGNQW